MRFLGDVAKKGFHDGLRILFKTSTYRGTRVWYKSVSYAVCWLEAQGLLRAKWTAEGGIETDTLHEAIDLLAIVQHVKCSPNDGKRSAPSAAMWRECGSHVLIHELPILRPSCVIVLGADNNVRALRAHVLPGLPVCLQEESVKTGKRLLTVRYEECTEAWGNVALLTIPHSATFGGTSLKLQRAVRQMLAR